ncbi:MAG: Gfo/Idh/MocA family oxidoreductase [Gemmatimonadota bacterium]|nr:Gfo/Idh/MocA family oxidoreductase [Gemmatimonadota bacterium]
MLIVDTALREREAAGEPVRVGMIGAGFMARGIALQLVGRTPGLRLVAIANRRPEEARRAYEEAGAEDVVEVATAEALDAAIAAGRPAVTADAHLVARAAGVDVVVEVTGAVEFGAGVALAAIEAGKHVVLMNAELDGTVGPLLKAKADEAGVVITNADGDQPGVILNLWRFVRGIGVRPVLCGNIKGLQDPYRNPTTQEAFAKKWGQKPHMVTSFADGTKISFEQAIVANATGMRVAKRGMHGPTVEPGTPIDRAVEWYPLEDLLEGPGIVDYVVGASPGPGVFVLGTHDDPRQQHYLNLYKLGEGPLYCFYTPYHLCHFEVPNTAARAALFGDAAIAPDGPPRVEVVATAKTDLEAGSVLDGIGFYMTYGQCENADVARAEGLLPMGVAEGCRLRRALPRDHVLTYDDVELPGGRLVDALRAEQERHFHAAGAAAARR